MHIVVESVNSSFQVSKQVFTLQTIATVSMFFMLLFYNAALILIVNGLFGAAESNAIPR